jgi:CHAD domain-containing protein
MAPNNSPVVCVYGAEVIQRYLSAFRKEYPGVMRSSNDIEYVHRMRVASRRLNIALGIFHDCFPDRRMKTWQKEVRQATRILGQARDLDIQTACVKGFLKGLSEPAKRPGVRRLLLRVIQKRQRLQKKLLSILDELDRHQTLMAIDLKSRELEKGKRHQSETGSVKLYSFASHAIIPALGKFLSYDPYVEQVDAVKELHAMRLAAKRLRYTLECFAPIYKGGLEEVTSNLRKIQENLGIIHDCDIWESGRDKFIEQERRRTLKYFGSDRAIDRLIPGLTCFFEYRLKQRSESYTSFVPYWMELRRIKIWDGLRKQIKTVDDIAGRDPT